jgi:hypothetical protein
MSNHEPNELCDAVNMTFVLWRTINLGRPVIGLTSKCEAGIMFN